MHRTHLGAISLFALLAGALVFAALATDAVAYDRYKDADGTAGTNCAACHGDFTDGTSPLGTTFPSDNKHVMHRASSNMNTECDLCHTAGDNRNPWIGSSDGTADNPGRGCAGCHGRNLDAGNDAVSAGRGAGLRQHHFIAGIQTCAQANCHTDANPANYTPVPENVTPTYYGTVDTDADLPCNGTAAVETNENWSEGDFLGLDNDGDGVYDGNEGDCFSFSETPGEASIRVAALDTGNAQLTIEYDSACLAQRNSLIFGSLDQVSTHAYSGAICDINNSGTFVWDYGADSLFFLLVANDAAGTEGSYGQSEGSERPTEATCGLSQNVVGTCN
jgi:hypothetical protein